MRNPVDIQLIKFNFKCMKNHTMDTDSAAQSIKHARYHLKFIQQNETETHGTCDGKSSGCT